jgi:hypothetical protein
MTICPFYRVHFFSVDGLPVGGLLNDAPQMALRVLMPLNEIKQVQLAGLMRGLRQPSAKQLVPQPHSVSVEHVGFAILGDLLDLALPKVLVDLAAIDAIGLTWHPHDPGDLVQRGLRP